jgi:formamidopyrimidine-DNA glycosylase
MPELPDVETFRRFLIRTAKGQTIETIDVRDELILRGMPARQLQVHVCGKQFSSMFRHGKYVFASLQPPRSAGPHEAKAGAKQCKPGKGAASREGRSVKRSFLVFHFGMTGYLRSFTTRESEPEYNRVIFYLSNGVRVAFNCRRRLGLIRYLEDAEQFMAQKHLGPDALRMDFQDFLERLSNRKGNIKCVLMDQSVLSGIGNIYADEILYQTRLHPRTRLSAINDRDTRRLFDAMRRVLNTAVAVHANSSRFPRTYLTGSRNLHSVCPRCGAPLETTRACGRTAYFCPQEQRLQI